MPSRAKDMLRACCQCVNCQFLVTIITNMLLPLPTLLRCTGRAKDTIVLLSGKNVEPAPIEAALERSSLIKHALLLGQDRRELGALVFPDEEALAAAGGLDNIDGNDEKLQAQLAREVAKYNSTRPDYRPEDHIGHIQVRCVFLCVVLNRVGSGGGC